MDATTYSVSQYSLFVWLIIYAMVLFIIGYLLMYVDKWRSVRNQWRIPEATLLMWAFLGGAFGAKLAQKLFRHKTRKEPFKSLLQMITYWNVFAYGLMIFAIAQQLPMFDGMTSPGDGERPIFNALLER